MTKEEVKDLFKRIKSHYSNFTTDEFKFKEWLKYLKDYENTSVNYQLDKFLKSDYASYEPKVENLVRYAKKVGESKVCYVKCQYCGETLLLENYEKHIQRESAVNYIQAMAKKYLGKEINYDKYMTMAQETLDEKYDQLLLAIKDKVEDKEIYGISPKKIIEKILTKEQDFGIIE